MAQVFDIKVNATYPSVKIKMEERNSAGEFIPVPGLDGATVIFTMESDCGAKVIDGEDGVLHNADEGLVRYDWSEGDTDTAGSYTGYFTVTLVSGRVLIEPSRPRDKLYIEIAESGS